MTPRRQATWWIGIAVGFGLMIWLLRDMLLPFVAGMAIAYLTDPLADRLERLKLSRTQATTVITVGFLALFIIALLLIVPAIVRQTNALLAALPDYMERAAQLLNLLAANVMVVAENQGLDMSGGDSKEALKGYARQAVNFFGQLAGDLLRGGVAVLNFFSLLVITPIVTFYLLLEWDRMVSAISGWLPKGQAEEIKDVVRRIDRTLAGFVRGQGTVCLVLIIYYSVALSAVGLNFGFVIGLLSGALSFIPFVGAIFGALASIGLAVVQFWPDDSLRIGIVVGIYVIGQVLEGYVLTPKLVGDSIGLHPVWVMFGVLAGGVLFGFVGMLLALPVSAVIGVLARYGLERYLASRLYDPDNPA
ncbi:MAG: AI-2E family transporter [Minwuia sp.]|uniref:AI-2E family transporter n=1 Tax=Minwuia sp. TaxID=2493630 RepID=UPI003A883A0E